MPWDHAWDNIEEADDLATLAFDVDHDAHAEMPPVADAVVSGKP